MPKSIIYFLAMAGGLFLAGPAGLLTALFVAWMAMYLMHYSPKK